MTQSRAAKRVNHPKEQYKKTPFFSWGSFQRDLRACCSKYQRKNKAQTLAKEGTLLSSPTRTAKKTGDTILQHITHGTFREASAEETSPTLYLFLVSPQESNSLHKRYWRGYSDRHSSQERLSLPPHCWNSSTLPTEMITRGMWLLSASTQGGGGNLGSKRNAFCYHKILRTSYFKS